MPKPSPIQLAELRSDDNILLSLGWTPRDARQRLPKPIDWKGDPWLHVHGRIRCPRGDWSFRDPALTEHEARDLADLLMQRPWTGGRTLQCIEPCLTFFTRDAINGRPALGIRFIGEVAPPWVWHDDHLLWHQGFTLELRTDAAAIDRFAATLRGMLGLKN